MKKEFKFVRGLYTNKPLFDDTIKEESLFILNQKGEEMDFGDIDDEPTQTKLLGASPATERERKLYTITPAQIVMGGKLVRGNTNSYEFTPTLKDVCVSDTTEIIPDVVREQAITILSELTANYNALTPNNIGIGENSNPDSVNVAFSYRKKDFVKQMTFKVTGKVDKKGLKNITGHHTGACYALHKNGNSVNPTNVTDKVFNNGYIQKRYTGVIYNFVYKEADITISEGRFKSDIVAKKYTLPSGFSFSQYNHNDIECSYSEEPRIVFCNGNIVGNFTAPNRNGYLFDNDSDLDKLYIINDEDNFVSLDDYFPYGNKNVEVYNDDSYYVYKGLAYENENENITYKILTTNVDNIDVENGYVSMLDIVTLSPIHGEDYIIEINPDNVYITATES